jgi:hypothetical protein
MKKVRMIILAVGIILSAHLLHAQTLTPVQSVAPDSIVQVTAEAQGLQLISPENLPPVGTYWEVMPYGVMAPLPCPPLDPTLPVYAITDNIFLVDATGGQLAINPHLAATMSTTAAVNAAAASLATSVVNLINQVQTAQANEQTRPMMGAMGMDVPSPGDGGGSGDGGGYLPMYSSGTPIDTNALWLEITNFSGGWSYLHLHNATNQVYAIWTTTNLLTSWNVEMELWPTYTNCQPFTIENFDRQNLFVRAEDWTGVWTNGLPDWWVWQYFHTLNLAATNLDSQGNTLGYDYTNHIDPNVISFLVDVTNNYVNTAYPDLQLSVYSGTPSYYAILTNDTNTADAVWQLYTNSNVVAPLGADGSYNVSVGLRGWPTNGTVTWQSVSLVKDTVAPLLTLTSPTGGVISNSPVALAGYANEALIGLTFDVSNSAGTFTNQQGFLAGQFYDTNLLAFTTNWFQCSADLINGTNVLTLHGTDWAGNTASVSFTFVYFNTNPPTLVVFWPSPNLAVSGGSFTVQAQVDSTATKIVASIADSSGDTNMVQGLIEKNGSVWIQNLPLNDGTNFVTMTAAGANGNVSVTNFNVIKNDVGLVIYPLESYQLNQSSVSVFGEIGDPSLCVWVNGVQATVNDDGTWEADGVQVSPIGTASLSAQVYVGDPVLVASQNYFQPQPVTVGMMSYSGRHDLGLYGNGTETINWSYNTGGNYYSDENGDAEISTNENGVAYIDFGWATFAFEMPWEYGAVTTPQFYGPDTYSYGNYTQTRVMVEPSGQALAGTTNLYLVLANAKEFSTHEIEYGLEEYGYGWDYSHLLKDVGSLPDYLGYGGDTPLPPEWLQIQGQTLVNAGITNGDGSVSGMTIVAAPAGVNSDVTPVATQVYQNQAYTFNVQAFDITPQMLVDIGRTGNANQLTTPDNPYRFWINDAQESGDVSGSQYYVPGSSSPNYANSQVNGHADVVNFFPISLSVSNALQMLPLTNGYEYHLSQADGAVKIIYSSLMPTNAFDYLTNLSSSGYGVNFNEGITNADTVQVTSGGITLDTNFLNQVQNNGGMGVILAEGCGSTTNPLKLEIWQNGQKLAASPLFLSISGVEQMYRWVNLRGAIGAPQTKATDTSEPANNPDSLSDGKNFVFVHGYNVGETAARGWNSEMFKRLYQSGSKAKFYAVTWDGSQSLGDYVSGSTANYQTNVVNAFLTAPYLASLINGLGGSTVLAGHSLGNMLCLSAISDSGAAPNQYFMIDAAVAIEAIDGTAPINSDMVTTNVGGGNWLAYSNRLWASEWYNLWTSTDARSTLAWNNRLMNLGSVDVYNFFSSGEDVLRDDPNVPPSSLLTLLGTELVQYIRGQLGVYVWAWQEKDKGLMSGNTILSSNHGGWLFNDNALNPHNYTTYTVTMANSIPSSQLQTNAFFDFGWHTFGSDFPDYYYIQVTNSSGSSYAAANRNRIISDAVPALTLPIGANYVTNLDVRVGDVRNFDMQALYENNWPALRQPVNVGTSATGEWHHSDIVNVAYPFNFQFFNQIVNVGNIK